MTDTSPIVTVIIPTYNHAHFLPQAVNSVLRQTLQDFEIIIVDDGSTDDTPGVIDRLNDSRIRYIYQKNRGLSAARNTGLREARGECLAFLDADDLFLPCKLEVQTRFLTQNRLFGFVAGGWKYIDETGQFIGEYNPWPKPPNLGIRNWIYGCLVNPVSVMVSRVWAEAMGGFDETLRQVEDWDMWLRMAQAGCCMGWIRETVCCYRLSAGQMTRNPTEQKLASVQMLDKFFSQKGLPTELERAKHEIYARLYLRSAGNEYGFGKVEEAKESLRKAVGSCPELSGNWDSERLGILFSWEDSLYAQTPSVDYRVFLFENLPSEAKALLQRRRWAMGEAGMKSLCAGYKSQDWKLVRRAAIVTARYSPKNMINRGFWSMLVRSLIARNAPQQTSAALLS